MSKQIQEQLQIRLKMVDDVFHNVIIALERLEIFLEQKRGAQTETVQIAINTDRDLHDDTAKPPTENSFHLELHTQCLALFFQTKFDKDKDTFNKVIKHFLTDLLTWYGGRKDTIPHNEVEKYFIPIVSALNRQVSNQTEISEIIKQYVIDIDTDIQNLSDEDKEKAVIEGFTAFTRASEISRKRNEEFLKSEEAEKSEFDFTSHLRGTTEDGYKRLLTAFLELYNEKVPVLILDNLVKQHLPELNHLFKETVLDKFFKLISKITK